MDIQLLFILALTFVIHLIGTLAFSFRIAGVRTRHIAIAFSLFNILVLVSRTANSFQAPFLAKRVELAIADHAVDRLTPDVMLILASAIVATIVGGFLVPTFQRVSTAAVKRFSANRSVVALLVSAASPSGLAVLTRSVAWPQLLNIRALGSFGQVPGHVIVLNVVATALWTVGGIAAIYAGALNPEFRVTASSLSAVINGFATIMLFVLVDPYLAGLTDDAVGGRVSDARFRRVVTWMVVSRLLGTLIAPAIFFPSAWLIARVSGWV